MGVAVAIEMDFEGATLEQYEQIMEKMGLEPQGPTPPGAIFHWVAQTPTGLRIIDVWETQGAFDDFAEKQIGPFSAEVGVPNPPTTTVRQVENYVIRPS
jgi:hypothetical protein